MRLQSSLYSLLILVLPAALCFGQTSNSPPTGSPKTANSGTAPKAVDIPTRKGVTQRILILAPSGEPKAAVILFAGGNGGLQLTSSGGITTLAGNFLVRSRQMFVDHGLLTVIIDAPSD